MKKSVAVFCALFFTAAAWCQCYTVTSIPYDVYPVPPSPLMLSTGDDQWSNAKAIGFPFCFYGASYDSLVIGTNGILSFNTAQAGLYCMWPIGAAIPSPVAPPNSIMAPWNDLRYDVANGRYVYYWTSGNQPNREFHVVYDSLPFYNCATLFCSTHIVLYETSNTIIVQLETKDICSTWNSGRAILGIQNQNGTMAAVVSGRNFPATWWASHEGWLFSPICNVCNGVGMNETGDVNGISLYPNPSDGNFTLQIQNANSAIASYDVIDVSGRVVLSAAVNPLSQQQVQFALENSGMYFIRVYDESDTMLKSEKIVVE